VKYVSLRLYGSTDKGVVELILYVWYIKHNGMRHEICALSVLQYNATADDFLDSIERELEKHE
jgi:hypothetical protein